MANNAPSPDGPITKQPVSKRPSQDWAGTWWRPGQTSASPPWQGGQNPYAPPPPWMSMPPPGVPPGMPAIPPGLQQLLNTDKLFIKQKAELLEAISGIEMQNQYEVLDNRVEKIFFAKERSQCCSRVCCGDIRPFEMEIRDVSGVEVVHLKRPFNCDCCLCFCCMQKIDVYSPPGVLAGSVEREWTICKPHFRIRNPAGYTVLLIRGPCCTMAWFKRSVVFDVVGLDGSVVGKISKEWGGVLREFLRDADLFGISFPMDLDVRMKAVVLGACFLIDFMYFESRCLKC